MMIIFMFLLFFLGFKCVRAVNIGTIRFEDDLLNTTKFIQFR